ncbi:receptor-like protein 7 [Malus domestica]|uniref:receptor-like protein 7 n=1 Tax=Malus domestica TaxID=3750 RepID=UPI0039754243
MKLLLISFVFLIGTVTPAESKCNEDDQSSLLRLKQSLNFNNSDSTKLVTWNASINCCSWVGVNCSANGYAVGLDLSEERILSGIDDSSSLFDLQHLQSLNFADNGYHHSQIPSSIGKLANLRYLDLSHNGFLGQIPIEISHLTRLIVLDLSETNLKLENPNLSMLIRNLTELEVLYLDSVNISRKRSDWCQVISSSLPKLRVLSLSYTELSGPIDDSLAKLSSLSVIRLDYNNIYSPVPSFFANFSNLISLSLCGCELYGTFPQEIFQISTLQHIYLSYNPLLQGSLPEFPNTGSLQTLDLSSTNFSGSLPDSIGNLKMLSMIDLSTCNFYGSIPESMENLRHLYYLDMSDNKFSGSINSTHWENLVELMFVSLMYNQLDGGIPLSMFSLPLLQTLLLSNNKFSHQFHEFSNVSSSNQLSSLFLDFNNLEGPVPMFFFNLRGLQFLSLSSNNLAGSFPLSGLQKLRNLTFLNLSYTSLFIDRTGSNSSYSSLPQLVVVILSSTKLRTFPDFLRYLPNLDTLDLAENQIHGEIPNWIWGLKLLYYLNISCNSVANFGPLPNLTSALSVLDLHSNQLQGQIPVFSAPTMQFLDYSRNNLSSGIPTNIGEFLTTTKLFSLSSNNLHGIIPRSLCNLSTLEILDLSNNSLSGMIPECLTTMKTLAVLNLRRNNLTDNISYKFDEHCSLETLDLSGNQIKGRLPESLVSCTKLVVLNLGYNQIMDTFPCYLKSVSTLRVLVLRSNKFYGGIGCPSTNGTWPVLQIIDVAHNNFNGELPGGLLTTWKAMMDNQADANHLQYADTGFAVIYYQNSVTIVSKDLTMDLAKILTIFTAVDFSGNKFHGQIPEEIGELKSLYILNFSNNAFTGEIPSSLSNLGDLESLDLSVNNLSGQIPPEFSKLHFLAFMNLSTNHLVGKIPSSTQFSTFPKSSFEGNTDLWGPPLTAYDRPPMSLPPMSNGSDPNSGSEINWDILSVEIGYFVGLGVVIGSLVFCEGWRNWYYEAVENMFFKMLPHLDKRNGNRIRGRRVYRNRSMGKTLK